MDFFNAPAGTHINTATLRQRLNRPDILMVDGSAAGVQSTHNENWFTQQFLKGRTGPIALPETQQDVDALAQAYRSNGHRVHVMPATADNIDGHYSTDSNKTFQAARYDTAAQAWMLQQPLTIFPNFTHTHRQSEVPPKRAFFEDTQHHLYQMQHPMEFGDTRIVLRDKGQHFVLAGLAENAKVTHDDSFTTIGRSTRAGHAEFAQVLQTYVDPMMQVHTIELRQPFYHMDTTGIPCTNGEFFTTRAAYTDASWSVLETLFGDKLIELPLTDIRDAFGGNGTCFGDQIYISDTVSQRTVDQLQDYGYRVNRTSIRHTMCSGGGHRCMTSACYTVVV